MNDEPGIASRYGGDGTLRGMDRIALQDEEANARLARELHLPPRRHRSEPYAEIATKPGWPGWAIPPGTALPGRCHTCGKRLHRESRTGICGACGHRLGGVMRKRVMLTLAEYHGRTEGRP